MTISVEEAQAAGLSQEEIDAINGVASDDDDAALAAIAGDGDNSDEEDEGNASDESSNSDEGDDESGDNGDGTAEGDESGGDDGGSAATGADGDEAGDGSDPFAGIDATEVAFVPVLTGELLPEFAQKVEQVYDAADVKLDDINERYNAGDLDEKERQAEIRKVEREKDAAIRQINAANQNAEIANQRWQAEQAAFFKDYPEYKKQPILVNALNAEVIRLANLPESENKNGLQILMAAKKSIDLQLQTVTGQVPGASTKPGIGKKPGSPRPGVQTLGGVPAAGAQDTGNSRFAHIDKLTGLAYEAALAAMNEADRTAYLAER